MTVQGSLIYILQKCQIANMFIIFADFDESDGDHLDSSTGVQTSANHIGELCGVSM